MNFKCLMGLTAAMVMTGARIPASAAETAVVESNVLSLEMVVSMAVSNNPSLKAARANWEAMKEIEPQAVSWEDPRAGVDVVAGRFVDVPQNSFTDQKFMAEQTVPISGRNRLQGKAASAEAVGAFEEFRRRQLEVTAQARMTYYQLANAYAQLDLNEKNQALLRQYSEISRAKFEAGTRAEADVLSAETDLARLEETAVDFQRQVSDAETRLNVLMNRAPNSPLGKPVMPEFKPVTLALEEVEALALEHRPALRMAERKIEAAQARLEAARRGWVPEPSLRVEADRYNGASQAVSEVSAGFSINLPWFNRSKYKAAIRQNEKMVESAQQELTAARLETLGMVRDQLKKIETFHHHAALSQSKLFLLSQQTVEAKRRGYETDKSDLLELLTAQQTVREIEAMYWEHLADYQMALAELEALVGAPLNARAASADLQHQHNLNSK